MAVGDIGRSLGLVVEAIFQMKRSAVFSEAFNALCVAWVLFHIYVILYLPISIDQLKVVHLGFACVIVFTKFYLDRTSVHKLYPKLILLAALLILGVTAYFFTDYENMAQRLGTPSTVDIVAGTIWVSLVLLGTYLGWGFIIPLLVALVSLYALFGNYTSGIFFHSGIDFPRFIGYSSTYFMGTLGTLTNFSATLIVHFLLFGALLTALGGADAINKIAILVGSRFRSGTAQTAVLSSCMVGMTTGSAPANVAITGAFTIPMMKRRGYSPEYAGAVEAVASTGGQIMPPIMSVVVFIMAGLTGISLAQIIVAAFLPAIIYFVSVSFSILVRTHKIDLPILTEDGNAPKYNVKKILLEHGYLAIPVAILTWRILIGESPHRAVTWGNASMVIGGLLNHLYLGRNNLRAALIEFFRKLYSGTAKCALEAAKLALILGSIGIVMETLTTTGFGQRLSYEIVTMAGGLSLALAVMVAVLVLFFGMGMPTAGAYLIAVLLSAPALIKVGFPELSVHMFVFYFAVLSQLTPPVSLAVLVAISISGGKYGKTALTAMILAIPGFVLPFVFLYQPAILGMSDDPVRAAGLGILVQLSICGLILLLEGYATRPVLWAMQRITGKAG
jgi:TRAP transporter 4TM/12TM fusion protein